MQRLIQFVETPWFQRFIICVIVLNGVILGVQTSPNLSDAQTSWLNSLDSICLAIFVIELVLRLAAYRLRFFTSGWNIFDFAIVAVSLVPASGNLSILRAFRILRVLRLVTAVPSFRRVVSGMLLALPGVGSVAGLLLLLFYIAGVLSTTLFGPTFPDWFGDLGKSMYTLFQIMTLESWSMGIVRPVMDQHPYAWLFFIPFITVTTFTVLNLFIGIVVDAMATVKEQETEELHQDHEDIESKLDSMRNEILEIKAYLTR